MKILTVTAMVMLALYNRYRLVPRPSLGPIAALALKRNTVIEIVLGGAVLALVSAFATFEPTSAKKKPGGSPGLRFLRVRDGF